MIRSSGGNRFGSRGQVLSLVLLVGVAFTLLGCTGPKIRTKSSPELDKYEIKTVVVIPFATLATPQVIRAGGHEVQVSVGVVPSDMALGQPPASRRLPRPTAVVPRAAGMTVARIFSEQLHGHPGIVVRSPTEAELAIGQLEPSGDTLTLEETGRRVALRLSADAALVGLLRTYKERAGSRFGADPAVVGFEVKLIAADGRVLWVGDYYEEQRPLTQDVPGFLERGLGFVTAEELALYGAEQLVGEFPVGKE